MVRKALCLAFALALGVGIASAIELGELIKDYGTASRGGTGVAVFSTDQPGTRALVVYEDSDGSGGYSAEDAVLGVKYFSVLDGRAPGSATAVTAVIRAGSPT